MARLWTTLQGELELGDLHLSSYDPDERVIPVEVRLLVAAALLTA